MTFQKFCRKVQLCKQLKEKKIRYLKGAVSVFRLVADKEIRNHKCESMFEKLLCHFMVWAYWLAAGLHSEANLCSHSTEKKTFYLLSQSFGVVRICKNISHLIRNQKREMRFTSRSLISK